MGIVLELGKVAAVSFLHRHWNTATLFIKSYLVVAVFILMFINSIGIFGYLSRAHIEQEVINNSQTTQVEIVLQQLDSEKSSVADLDKQISQIDNALQKLTDTGRASTSLQQSQVQRKQRDSLVAQKLDHQKKIDDLTKQKVESEANNKKLEADFGPLKYIADAVYGKPTAENLESTVKWIITILVFVFDPLAIVLLVSAQFSIMNRKNKLTNQPQSSILRIDDF